MFGRSVLDSQAVNITPATKGAMLDVRGSVAKMRTHAFAKLFCYLCTLVGGTLTFDRVDRKRWLFQRHQRHGPRGLFS